MAHMHPMKSQTYYLLEFPSGKGAHRPEAMTSADQAHRSHCLNS